MLSGISVGLESAVYTALVIAAAAKLHHEVLDGADSPDARAILRFFDSWDSGKAAEHPALFGQLEEVTAGANLIFRVDGRFPQKDAAIRDAWQRNRENGSPDAVRMQCLVTGREDEIAAVHPALHARLLALVRAELAARGASAARGAGLSEARAAGIRTCEINLEPSDNARHFDETRYGPAGEAVPRWVESILGG